MGWWRRSWHMCRRVCVCVYLGGGQRRCEDASIDDWLTRLCSVIAVVIRAVHIPEVVTEVVTAVSSCDVPQEDRRRGGKGVAGHGRLLGATRGVVRGHGGP